MSGGALGRSRDELEQIVRPHLAGDRIIIPPVTPSQVCNAQEYLLRAFISPKPPVEVMTLMPSVVSALQHWIMLPLQIRRLVGTLALHWVGWTGKSEHAYIVLDALTFSGSDGHDYGLYVLCARVLPLLRMHAIRATYPRF